MFTFRESDNHQIMDVRTLMLLSKGGLISTKVAPLWGAILWNGLTQDIINDPD